jgi:agmatinase
MTARVALLGLPTDINSSFVRGPAGAPGAIRAHLASGVSNWFAEDGTDLAAADLLADAGDVAITETPADLDAIAEAAAAIFRSGAGLFLGGDHFVTWPVLVGLRRAGLPPPHIVHVDAHPDLYPDFEANPHSHASPFARIMEAGLAASLTQIGIRTVNAVQKAQIARYGVCAFPPRRFAEALAALPAGPTYLSIDLDGLDPAFAPGVSHHEPGGLSVRELLDLIEALPGPVIGADIVELNPDRDMHGMTAAVAAKLVKELAARMLGDSLRAAGAAPGMAAQAGCPRI